MQHRAVRISACWLLFASKPCVRWDELGNMILKYRRLAITYIDIPRSNWSFQTGRGCKITLATIQTLQGTANSAP